MTSFKVFIFSLTISIKKGVYGDPGIGRTENALKKHYEKRFEQNNIMNNAKMHMMNF